MFAVLTLDLNASYSFEREKFTYPCDLGRVNHSNYSEFFFRLCLIDRVFHRKLTLSKVLVLFREVMIRLLLLFGNINYLPSLNKPKLQNLADIFKT